MKILQGFTVMTPPNADSPKFLTQTRQVFECRDSEGNIKPLEGEWFAQFGCALCDGSEHPRKVAEATILNCIAEERHIFREPSKSAS